MESLKPFFAPVEALLAKGGARKDAALIAVSAAALAWSFAAGSSLPADPAWIAIVLCGVPIVIEAFIALVTELDVKADLLVSIALIASLATGEYFAAGEVAAIMQLGALLEELTVARAQKGVRRLVDLTPTRARIVREDGSEEVVAAQNVPAGAVVRVLPGETVPVDGMVVSGTTSVDESVVTGESMPRDKTVGDEVCAGTTNQFGSVDVRATSVGEDSSIQRMARLVASADAGKAKIVRLADRWATWVVAGALAAAAAVFVATGEIERAVTVLVVFCPCSLVLATPTAIVAAIGNASKHGFLVKEGDALERLAQVNKVVFDKTGTLTKGEPRVSAVIALDGPGLGRPEALDEKGHSKVTSRPEAPALGREALYPLVAGAEKRSEHPLGRAVVACAQAEDVSVPEPGDFSMQPGRGVVATVNERQVAVGNEVLMTELGLAPAAWAGAGVEALLAEGSTLAYVAVDGRAAGVVALSDTVRDDSADAVARLRELGVASVLLSGDAEQAARSVARRLGIRECLANCRPEGKLRYIEGEEAAGRPCAMVGDGVNDAPALKRSFVGIAVGGVGSDVAVEAADVVIVDEGVSGLPHLVALSRHMTRVIRANLAFSMTLNFVAVALAFRAVLDPVSGALVHNCGSVFVIVCSGLLLGWHPRRK